MLMTCRNNNNKKDDKSLQTTLCSEVGQEDFRNLPRGGTAESAHKDAPGCCAVGTWKSCSASSVVPRTKAGAGSKQGNVRVCTHASDVLATSGQKTDPSGAFPECTKLQEPPDLPRLCCGQTAAPWERIKTTALQSSIGISESKR